MAAYAALVSLMNNIEQIQRHTRLPISLDQNQTEYLLEKVSFFIAFLESYNSHRVCQEMNDLESRITDAAYALEDIIETHVVDRINAHSRSGTEENKTVVSYLPGIGKVLEDIEFIKEEVEKIKKRRGFNGLQTMSPIVAHSSSSIHVGKNSMVGFNNELIELMERLTGEGSSRQIIPIVGMGGMGKTTLAKTAYEKPLIVHYFDFRACVTISQEYSLRQILLRLLGNESSQMSDEQLGDSLYKSLCGRRYLVVLDDLWSVEAWEMIKVFFPEYKNGSRIIITTRISSFAAHFGWSNLEMNFLDEDTGWNLLCEKVFGQEDCPHELEEVGRNIVNNCQGLPLSIVVIGGFLAKTERTKEYWEHIERDTKAIVSLEGDEMCTKILYLSYLNLPLHLKPCFLYTGVFPEDKEISVRLLIKLWIAEGFLKPNGSKDLEVVATEYLNDLSSRNLIIVCEIGMISGKIKYCMIHDLLRNLCLKEAHKGKFMHVPKMHIRDEVQCIGSHRRICIPEKSLHIPNHPDINKTGLLVRSVICPTGLSLQNFRLLRVLKGCDESIYDAAIYSLGETLNLVNSRFIAIKTIECPKIPPSILLLWNLQVLIVLGIQKVPTAPLEIWEMTELRHLQFEWSLYLPDPPSEQTNRRGGTIIMKLHTLKYIEDFRLSDEVVKRIPNIKKLHISYVPTFTGKELDEQCLKNLGLLENLESLTLSFEFHTGSSLLSYLTFPNSLQKLSLLGCGLRWEDMSMIGSLPHLQVLKLKHDAFIGPNWAIDEEGFYCLKFLQIYYCNDLVHWKAEDVHFPCLEYLRLEGLEKLVEIPSGIGDIPTLQKIELEYCSNSVVISAKKILEEQENLGNVGLRVWVIGKKDTELESLATDNFLVDAW